MTKLLWTCVVIVGLAAAALAVWVARGGLPPSPANPPAEAPSLTAPGGVLRVLPKAHETTDRPIEEGVEVQGGQPPPMAPTRPAGAIEVPLVIDAGKATVLPPGSLSEDSHPSAPPAIPPAAREVKPRLGIIPFKVMGDMPSGEQEVGDKVAQLILAQIDADRYDVFERTQLADVIKEKDFQQSDLVGDNSTAARFGGVAGIDSLVIGNVMRLGGEYHLTARLVDCRDGRVVARAWVSFPSIADVAKRLPELLYQLKLRPAPVGAPPGNAPPPTGAAGAGPVGNHLLDDNNPAAPFKLTIRTAQDRNTFLEGDRIGFVVEADRDCFVTLISVDSEGQATLLFPNASQPDAHISSGMPTIIPGPDADFLFRIKPPHGETLVKAIGTLEPLRLRGVTAKGIEENKFAALGNYKGIGVEAAESEPERIPRAQPQAERSLHDLLGAKSWTTAELTIVTRKQGADADRPAPQSQPSPVGRLNQVTPLDFRSKSEDPNDQVLARWQQLTGRGLPPSPGLLKPAAAPAADAPTASLLVFTKSTTTGAQAPSPGPESASSLLAGMRLVDLQPGGVKSVGSDADQRLAELRADPDVLVAVPNFRLRCQGLPATRLASVQWALHNQFSTGHDIGFDKVANRIKGAAVPLIGIVDGDVDFGDPRLAHAAWINPAPAPDRTPGPGPTAGPADDIHGWNFVTNSNRLSEPNGPPDRLSHGTFVCSIIAARPIGSESDVIGILPQAKLVVAVVMNASGDVGEGHGSGDLQTVLRGIAYVADRGAKVINLSLGQAVTPEQLADLNRLPLWDELEKRGVILVCAAGNDDSDNDRQPYFPANLPRPNVISVMATDAAGRPGRVLDPVTGGWRQFTNYGKRTVQIAAPGTLVLGAGRGGQALLLSGTSYAAAYVTAAVALARAGAPADASPAAALHMLRGWSSRSPDLGEECVESASLGLAAANVP